MPLSPALEILLSSLGNDAKPFHQLSVADARIAFEGYAPMAGPAPDLDRTEVVLPVEDGSIRVWVYSPPQPPRAVMLFLHGGGWVVGSVDGYDRVARQLAAATGATVVLPDYRLAPEHRFPKPLNDCVAAAVWAKARFDLPLVVLGDSAGGNLAAALVMIARTIPTIDLAGQVLIYPVTDCDMSRPSYVDPANHVLLSPEDMAWFWDHYVPDPAARANPLASPLRADLPPGLPPAFVVTAEYDVLRDEGAAYAARLSAAGAEVRHDTVAGQAHGFFVLGGVLPESASTMRTIGGFLDDIL